MYTQRIALIPALWIVSTVASAAPTLTWMHSTTVSDDDPAKVTQACVGGDVVVGGGVISDGVGNTGLYMASRALLASAPSGTDEWRTVTSGVDGGPLDTREYEVSALCAAPEVAACIERVDATWDPDTTPEKQVTAECPKGMLAFAGGAEITGTTYGRGFRRLGPGGLFIPTSWVADVDEYADDVSFASDWGVHVVAFCAPVPVYTDHIDLMFADNGDNACFDSDCMMPGFDYAVDASYVYGDPGFPNTQDCPHPLSVGMGGDPGRFIVDNGAEVSGGLAASYRGRIGSFTFGVHSAGVGVCADSLSGFAVDLAASCAEPEPDPEPDPEPGNPLEIDLSRWAIGGTILYGVIQDGGGVIWIPGRGPVPVDPGPTWSVQDPLPVGVVRYDDSRGLDSALDALARELDEARLDYAETVDVSDALARSGLLLVVPEDEARAVSWLSDNRERLAERDAPVLVYLQKDGVGEAMLARW